MTASASRSALQSLAARLTDQEDREAYAGLISYFDSLPPNDELFHLVQLLGLLSLLGQRVPEALAELLAELREQTKLSAEYRTRVEARLKNLPQEIAEGVGADTLAKTLSESLRQQVAATGLQDAATLLDASTRDIKALSGQVSGTLKPLLSEYQSISATLSTELAKLTVASKQLARQNACLPFEERSSASLWQSLAAVVLFLAGGICGILLEKHQTTDGLANLYVQIEHLRHLPIPVASLPANKERKKRPGTTVPNRGTHSAPRK